MAGHGSKSSQSVFFSGDAWDYYLCVSFGSVIGEVSDVSGSGQTGWDQEGFGFVRETLYCSKKS